MKILSADQIRQWDAYTIQKEPIPSIELMERASLCFVNWFSQQFSTSSGSVKIICGPGNNGGDGLAIARLLHYRFYEVQVFICKIGKTVSKDFSYNLNRLPPYAIPVQEIKEGDAFPAFEASDLVIDAIFGSGLNRPILAYWATLVEHLNASKASIVAVDIPSGLFADQQSSGAIINAQYTFSFECPKLAFFFPQNHPYLGDWTFDSIGLSPAFAESTKTPYHYINQALIQSLLKLRSKFDHKGNYGHALLVMGSYGKVGAAILAARAALRSGTGLVTIHAPQCAYPILQMSVPEAMVSVDLHQTIFSGLDETKGYKAIGVGCGMGTNEISFEGLAKLMVEAKQALVLDADALNIIAQHPALFSVIPKDSILTPHPKEFERLFGKSENEFERNHLQIQQARELNAYIILKGAHTAIACPDSRCYFNSTGNPGMATGGSGDVLTGIITGLVAQAYTSLEASLLGVYLHGLAGDLAVKKKQSMEALIASDLIDHLGVAFRYLQQK